MHLSPELRLWCMKKKKKSRRFDLSVAPFSAFSALMQATIHIPQHIAIVMDGNGRWAIQKGLPRIAGHRKGVEVVRDIARACAERGIAYLTLFAFSSENWRRPKEEVAFLMRLFTNALEREIGQLHENGIRAIAAAPNTARRSKNRAQYAYDANGCSQLRRTLGYPPGRAQMRIQCAQRGPPNLAERAQRSGYCKIFGDCLRARTRPVDPNRRRAAHQQFSAMATGVYRTLFYGYFLAGFQR